MANAFGESYVKLPPITGENAVEIDGENSKRISSGVGRDQHGLVRLPPIVRLDSLRSAPSTAQVFANAPGENKTEMSTQGTNLKFSQKMDVLRRQSAKQLRKHKTEKPEDEKKLISSVAAKETDEVDTNVFDSVDWSYHHEKASLFKPKERSRGNYEALAPSKDSLTSRRGSASVIKDSAAKLSRSRRLAKSSPELFYRKINLKSRTSGNVNDDNVASPSTALSADSYWHRPQARLSIHDIDGSVLSHLQSTLKSNEKKTKRKKPVRSQTDGKSSYQPLSTPNSPVCSESANNERKEKGRRSLNDITEAVKQFVDRRRPSISLPRKQNLVEETVKLKIEGKSCPQAETTAGDRTPTFSIVASPRLQSSQNKEKRASLYDLQQILGLLQKDDLKHQSSSTSLSPEVEHVQSGRSSQSRNASVYDLKEFLKLTVAAGETSTEKEMKKQSGNKAREIKTREKSTSPVFLSPKQEMGPRHLDDARKGSVYDLKEFLSLGNAVDSNSLSTSENSSRSTSPQIVFSPLNAKQLLSFTQPTEARRSSTYDLMEFLSLPQSGGISRPQSGQSYSSSQGDNAKSDNRELNVTETDRDGREARSLSVYDLAEYLAMTSGVPPLVRVISSADDQTEKTNSTSLGASGIDNGNTHKRESVYDLREMLNIMQQEHEAKRESTHNLPEILAYFHREASSKEPEHQTSTHPKNSHEDKTGPSLVNSSPPSPGASVSSGYSSDSPSSGVQQTDSKGVEVSHNTSPRQMSVYDLKEFLSLYASQKNTPNHQLLPAFRRKFSNISQSGISIHVTDEWNRSLDLETDDVFLPVPAKVEGKSPETKRSSVYDLREFLDLLNADESPLRRRLSSVSSASTKSSESEPESFQSEQKLRDANSPNQNPASPRPGLSPRQDSGGNASLYDLGEFLSILNTDESPLRRRLSSASDFATQDDSSNQAEDFEKTPLHSLGEILSVLNDFEQKKVNENAADERRLGSEDEISITVPLLPQKKEKTSVQTLATRKCLLTSPQKSLSSVRETSE